MVAHNSNGDQNSVQIASSNGVAGVNHSVNSASASTTTSTIAGLLHQNSINSRQQSSMTNANSPYGGSSVQISSPGSSSTVPQVQQNLSAFQSSTPSSNNPPQTSHSALGAANHMNTTKTSANVSLPQQQPSLSGEADPNDAQSSVHKIIHDMMMSTQTNNGTGGMGGVGSLGNDVKNGILPASSNTGLNSGNCLVGNGAVNSNSGVGVGGFGTMGGGLGQSALVNGIRAAIGNNSVMNGRGGMASMARDQAMNQQDLSNQLLSGLGAVNAFNNLQFDWKPSP